MGLTLIRKSDGRRRKRDPKIALVLAGGAVSGGAFKVGGLKALDDYLLGRRMTDFDTYVGLSAGALLAVPLAGGIPPDEMIRVLQGTSTRFSQLRPVDFYTPNWREFGERPLKLAYDFLSSTEMLDRALVEETLALDEKERGNRLTADRRNESLCTRADRA